MNKDERKREFLNMLKDIGQTLQAETNMGVLIKNNIMLVFITLNTDFLVNINFFIC